MSGLEIVAAVAAVISAFHGGSELLQHVKKKRRARKARDLAQQEWEEEQLQTSLIVGEQQIDLRYKQDQRELGDFVRIGDDIARDRLYHVALMLQAEIINSLKLAATSEFCVLNLNLRLLHEASITNRKETLVTLDELKQRIYVTRPMARQLREATWEPRAIVQTIPTNNHSPIGWTRDDMMQSSASHPVYLDSASTSTRHALTEYCRADTSRAAFDALPPSQDPTQSADAKLSVALEGLRLDDRAAILENIQQMISSYNTLSVENRPDETRKQRHLDGRYPERRDTLAMLHDENPYDNVRSLGCDPQQMFRHSPSNSAQHALATYSEPAAFVQNLFDAQRDQYSHSQQHVGTSQTQLRWSDASQSSSADSNAASLNRNNSDSSQGSMPQAPPLISRHSTRPNHSRTPPSASYQHLDEYRRTSSSDHAGLQDRYTPSPIAPLAPLRTGAQSKASSNSLPRNDAETNAPSAIQSNASSPTHAPWPESYNPANSPPIAQYTSPQQYSVDEAADARVPMQRQHYASPPAAHAAPSMRSNDSENTVRPSASLNNTATTAILGPAGTTSQQRHPSITPSLASTNSSSSVHIGIIPGHRTRNPIRTDTIQSGPACSERMMHGRPDKENDYWGFCKGAWAVREEPKKGIALRTQPSGYYNTKQIWSCKSCTFSGEVFKVPDPKKKGKMTEIVDPRVKVSMSGIRYRWIFLAKSHVKKKAGDVHASNEDNFGCVLCSAEGNVTGIYGGVETLMNHIALTHVGNMSEATRKKVNCVLGRVAGSGEEFDINMPNFWEVEELAVWESEGGGLCTVDKQERRFGGFEFRCVCGSAKTAKGEVTS